MTAHKTVVPGKTAAPRLIYQIRIILRGIQPPIWRQVQVPAHISLERLHGVIQAAMGWTNSHLHQFIIEGQYYSLPEFELDEFSDEVLDECRFRLRDVISGTAAGGVGSRFRYEYDFGDNWQYDLLVEKQMRAEPGVSYPRCLAGRRACPPEDCGGVSGYEELLEALADPEYEEHDDMKMWVGGHFEAEAFDVEKANRRMKRRYSR